MISHKWNVFLIIFLVIICNWSMLVECVLRSASSSSSSTNRVSNRQYDSLNNHTTHHTTTNHTTPTTSPITTTTNRTTTTLATPTKIKRINNLDFDEDIELHNQHDDYLDHYPQSNHISDQSRNRNQPSFSNRNRFRSTSSTSKTTQTTPSTTHWIPRYRHRSTATPTTTSSTPSTLDPIKRGSRFRNPLITRATTSTTYAPPTRVVQSTTTTSTTTTTEAPPKRKEIDVQSFCLDPGRPPKSQVSPVQLTYVDGEQVTYTCDEFISFKQHRRCVKGQWIGDTPVCGQAFRDNDLKQVLIYEAEHGFPTRLLAEYNLTNQLQPFNKFGQSFLSDRYARPIRASNSSDYYWNLFLTRPSMIQLIRISFAVVNHLVDWSIRTESQFDVVTVATNQHRECRRVSNQSVSPWHYNSTRFDYWYVCRAKSKEDFERESIHLTNVIRVETQSRVPIQYDLTTLIVAEQYSVPTLFKSIDYPTHLNGTTGNPSVPGTMEPYPDPLCGIPETPVGLESRVINDQSSYVFTCARDYVRASGAEPNYEYNPLMPTALVYQKTANNSQQREQSSLGGGGQYQMLQCAYDNRWHGQLPRCHPVKTCPKFHLEPLNGNPDEDPEGPRNEEEILLEVYKYDRVFFTNETHWIPVKGTRAFFRCKNERDKFVGKEVRLCDDGGQWTNSMPICFKAKNHNSQHSLKTGTVLLIVFITLLITFILSALMIWLFLKLRTQEHEQQLRLKLNKKQQQQQQAPPSLSFSYAHHNQSTKTSNQSGVSLYSINHRLAETNNNTPPNAYYAKTSLRSKEEEEEEELNNVEQDLYEIVDTRRLHLLHTQAPPLPPPPSYFASSTPTSTNKPLPTNMILGPRVIYTDRQATPTPIAFQRQTRSNSSAAVLPGGGVSATPPQPPATRSPLARAAAARASAAANRAKSTDSQDTLTRPYLTMTSRTNSPTNNFA